MMPALLKKKLEEAGYTPYLHEDLHTLYNCITDASGKPEFETICQLRIENGRYACLCFGIDADTRMYFDNTDKLVAFIKQKYPVQKNLSSF